METIKWLFYLVGLSALLAGLFAVGALAGMVASIAAVVVLVAYAAAKIVLFLITTLIRVVSRKSRDVRHQDGGHRPHTPDNSTPRR